MTGLAAALLGLIALTAAAAAQPSLQCTGAQKPWMVAELLFGRGNVSDFNWDRFLAAEVTPRFPDGLTVYDARGQWRNPQSGTISRERTKVVMIAMPPDAGNEATGLAGDHRGLQNPLQTAVGRPDRPAVLRVFLGLNGFVRAFLPFRHQFKKSKPGSWTLSSLSRLTRTISKSFPPICRTRWSKPPTSIGAPSENRVVVGLNRFDWEAANGAAQNGATREFRRRRAALRFERVLACKCRNLDCVQKDQVLNLLAVEFNAKDQPAGTVTLDILRRRRAAARCRMPGGRAGRSWPVLDHRLLPRTCDRSHAWHSPEPGPDPDFQTGLTRALARAIEP